MPSFNFVKKIDFTESFRVKNIIDTFDLSDDSLKQIFKGDIPIENMNWNIGVIVGKSGTGKSSIAKHLWSDNYILHYTYDNKKSLIDNMPDNKTMSEITECFTKVGFGTVYSWIKKHEVLSEGEKMRVDIARAMLSDKDFIVFDEYTSTVDREVAKTASCVSQKYIRKNNKKFIFVTCHSDILEWLEPDWVFSTDTFEFKNTREFLRRPKIQIDIYSTSKRNVWEMFKKYHYLNTSLNNSSKCFVAFLNDNICAFYSYIHFPHPKSKMFKREHRLCVLPDYQGLSIGTHLSNYVADTVIKKGYRFITTISSKGLIKNREIDNRWKITSVTRKRPSYNLNNKIQHIKNVSQKRTTVSVEYIGAKNDTH